MVEDKIIEDRIAKNVVEQIEKENNLMLKHRENRIL